MKNSLSGMFLSGLLATLTILAPTSVGAANIAVAINGSSVLDQPSGIRRISVSNGDIAEAIAVSSTEVVINGKTAGDTNLIIWDQKGSRTIFQIHVPPPSSKLDAVRAELLKEIGTGVSVEAQDGAVFLNGTAKDAIAADRAANIAGALGKVVNLLRVNTPATEPQILLKVRFADVDRTASAQFGINLFTAGQKGLGSSTTGQYGSTPSLAQSGSSATWSLTNLLNIFYYRPDINLGAVLQDLATKNVLQILAEPNLLTISGKPASFLSGGEFPFPTLQGGGSGVGQITISFKEFGIRLNFLPTVTPRGTIRLMVNPEVSSLDYANGLTVSGFTVPGLSSRKVKTEIELESGQSFVIAGLLDNQVTEQLSRMPGLADIPLLGKLFQSRSVTKSNSELLIMVTPEILGPMPAGAKPPQVVMPSTFLEGVPTEAPRQPSGAESGKLPAIYKRDSVAIEEVKTSPQGSSESTGTPNLTIPLVALPAAPATPNN
jgi:pilus assembly protein CpaC